MRKRKPTRRIRELARTLAVEGSYTDGYFRYVVKPARKGALLGAAKGQSPKHDVRIYVQTRMRMKDLLVEEITKLKDAQS